MSTRKLCVITGTRAEYGLLRLLMQEIAADKKLTLQVIATGAHLAPEFGLTYRDIEADGINIDAKIEMLLAGDTAVSVTKSMGVELMGLGDALARLRPDMVVLLGDRYEMLMAAAAAMVANIPIAHLHGGETTEGAIDEHIRHAITKMAAVHLVSHEEHARRIRQMGENPANIHIVGALGWDNIKRLNLLSREELAQQLQFALNEKFFLVTYHPVTASKGSDMEAMEALESLINALNEFPDYDVLITKANSDAGGREINKRLDDYAARYPRRVCCRASLGQLRYLSALKYAAAVVGNSSSGLVEAPILGTPTVNIGERQKGRRREMSVIDCAENSAAIRQGICQAISPEFSAKVKQNHPDGGDGKIAERCKNILRDIPLNNLYQKHFFAWPEEAK